MSQADPPAADTAAGPARRRSRLGAAAAAVTGIDVLVKMWAQRSLPPAGVELGPVDLRLGYNAGVAFSVGSTAPSGVIVGVTALITAGVAIFAWRAAPHGGGAFRAALALVLGGATANLIDRFGDGVVTDYLYSGWWPTFNLADTAIVTGVLLLLFDARLESAPGRRAGGDTQGEPQ